MTIVVVMLSSTEDIRNVIVASSHSRRVFLRVVICLVMTSKPPWVSMMSTMVIAPIRKTSISHVLPSAPSRSEEILAWSRDGLMEVENRLRRLHITQHRSRATDDLLMFSLFSMAMST